MKRVILLAVLGLGVPTAALATSVDFSFSSGSFMGGTITNTFRPTFQVTVVGSTDTIGLDTDSLARDSMCFAGFTCYSFSDGSVTVKDAAGDTVFEDSLSSGAVIRGPRNVTFLIALLAPKAGLVNMGSANFSFTFSGPRLTSGNATVMGTVIPEPSTLGLVGTGLIGLAGMGRRRLERRGSPVRI